MTEYHITPLEAEDVDGYPMPLDELLAHLQEVGAHKWPGRVAALEEIERGPVCDAEDLDGSGDDTIAGYLLLTRSDVDPAIPILSSCAATIERAHA